MAALATTTLSAAVTAGGTQWPLASLAGVLRRFMQGMGQKYQLKPDDKLDITTGMITRAADALSDKVA